MLIQFLMKKTHWALKAALPHRDNRPKSGGLSLLADFESMRLSMALECTGKIEVPNVSKLQE